MDSSATAVGLGISVSSWLAQQSSNGIPWVQKARDSQGLPGQARTSRGNQNGQRLRYDIPASLR